MQTKMGSFISLEEAQNQKTINQFIPRNLPIKLLPMLLLLGVIGIVILYINIYTNQYAIVTKTPSKIQKCVQETKNLESWIKPPSSLFHDMNDTELFWRASFVPKVNKYPFKRTPKIAFMFLTRGPLPMAALWERFFKGNEKLYSIYVHSLPSYRPEFLPSSAFYRRHILSQVAEWGMMSMCDAERRLLANALLNISNEWFVLLSEACIPLRNFSTIYHYISNSQFSFIGAFDEPGPNGRGRYNEKMSPEVNITDWRKGSQWFEINRKLAVDIIQDNFYYPKFKKFCKPDCYVNEHYFPTMLSIESPHLLANRSLTWVDWSRGGPHPATFGKDDITDDFFREILHEETCVYNDQPNSPCFLFARKFSPSALDRLLENSVKFFGF
ncbi:hypothetical protein CDL12_04481 [Handroanthus impetiginosus]|uniref:Branching enzyme n=1 Tax=Handroanthus impetiginosus TaxID=429701 RepID=A0A2G9HZ96_9LAMI|nr:hypothetical protein CDL12_04481 [Handroanthus impetiginosus]